MPEDNNVAESLSMPVMSKDNLSYYSTYIKNYVDKTRESIQGNIDAMTDGEIDVAWGEEEEIVPTGPVTSFPVSMLQLDPVGGAYIIPLDSPLTLAESYDGTPAYTEGPYTLIRAESADGETIDEGIMSLTSTDTYKYVCNFANLAKGEISFSDIKTVYVVYGTMDDKFYVKDEEKIYESDSSQEYIDVTDKLVFFESHDVYNLFGIPAEICVPEDSISAAPFAPSIYATSSSSNYSGKLIMEDYDGEETLDLYLVGNMGSNEESPEYYIVLLEDTSVEPHQWMGVDSPAIYDITRFPTTLYDAVLTLGYNDNDERFFELESSNVVAFRVK